MSKHDNSKPGDVTPKDLRDALRVNRALEHAAQADIDYRDKRIAREHELINEALLRIAEHEEDAQTAPQRLIRIRATIARQDRELVELEGATRATAKRTATDSREQKIAALTARIVAGDQTAIAELVGLTKGGSK